MKIILLHGALGAAEQLEPLSDALQQQGLEPVILELPGHGKTELHGVDFSIEGFADWLDKKMEEQQLWNSPFFGFSMGGYIMLYLLSKKDRSVGPVITLGTKFRWDRESAIQETARMDPDKLLEKVPEFVRMLDERHYDWKKVLLNTKRLMLSLGAKPLLKKDALSEINQKVLILRGEADKMVTEAESAEVAQILPHGIFKRLPGIPHPLEQVPFVDVAREIRLFANEKK